MTDKQAHIEYFDSLRLISALAVIMLHIGMPVWPQWDIQSTDWQVLNLYYCFTRFCVPVFFMISGALFINPNNQIPLRVLYRKNILRLLLIYFVWTILYGLYRGVIEGLDTHQTLDAIFRGQHHLWFLPALIIMYVLVPIFQLVAKDKAIFAYLTLVFFISTFILFSILLIPEFGVISHLIQKHFPLNNITGEMAYFLLGYWLYQYDVPKFIQKVSLPLSILSGLGVVFITAQYSLYSDFPYSLLGYRFILVALQASFLFIFFKYYNHKLFSSSRLRNTITRMAPYMLGVYLLHDGVLMFFRKVGLQPDIINPIFAIPLLTLLCFLCSLILTYLIKQIPVINKYLV